MTSGIRTSDYIVIVDESGDHGLDSIDEAYPIFVLCFCIFDKETYATRVIPDLTRLKFRTFGHDNVILHAHDIRKKRGAFSALGRVAREEFLNELTTMIEATAFTIVAVVIRKDRLQWSPNPYHIAMQYGLERVHHFLQEKGQGNRRSHVLFECRGKKEDDELELEFRRVCDGKNATGKPLPLSIEMVDKKSNSPGLQLADMTARPVGLMVLRPDQRNRTRDVLEKKFYLGTRFPSGPLQKWGFGLKVFP